MSATTVSNQPELSLSSLSLDSYSTDDLDWDRSQTEIDPSHPSITHPADQSQRVHGDVSLADNVQQRSLVDLLRLRTRTRKEGGDDVELSPSEEQALEEELGRWINSDSSPYEEDKKSCRPSSFAVPRLQHSPSPDTRPRSSTLNGRQKQDDSSKTCPP
ncbi:hypothetical protein M407DRAFT_176925 [Tulasnella calospora MUT 4182]|uniref:Uncharacterized protein n=1 Tax=Tulasnella calospora MUT 4182 TaxID=1051891 RepID=A0A0C3QD71_9AGAM|nr:hypothetical protein M407DRAFT_176925 [Tulasnella calospora MUT 4182]